MNYITDIISWISEFGISILVTFSPKFCLNHGQSIISSSVNRNTRQKPSPNPKSLAISPHVPAGIRTQAVVRDSKLSTAVP